MFDVFISYPRSARSKVEPIKARLTALGLDCYFDIERIDGGANFPDVIDRALRSSKAVLCCWTAEYFKRPWCMIECRDAIARDIMTPVAIERFDAFDPPADLRQLNWFDLVNWDGDLSHEEWRRTLLCLGRFVGRNLAASPAAVSASASARADNIGAPAPDLGAAQAGVLSDLRATWADFPATSDETAVARFLDRVRSATPGSGLEFEVEHRLDQLRRERERQAEEAARADAVRRAREAAHSERRREEQSARLRPGAVWRDAIPGLPKNACPEMVTIAQGAFLMGADGAENHDASEAPQHEVRIRDAFALGVYPVTFAEWDGAIAVGAKLARPVDHGWGRERRPVVNISWNDARAYIAWLNMRLGIEGRADAYRLPAEAEWEYACRAGTTTPYSFGTAPSASQANYLAGNVDGDSGGGDRGNRTAPVGSFAANAFGLHDMHGNVWEWCEDVWQADYGEPGRPDDGSPWTSGPQSRRVVRGGSWKDGPSSMRSAARRSFGAAEAGFNIGFRLARKLTPPTGG